MFCRIKSLLQISSNLTSSLPLLDVSCSNYNFILSPLNACILHVNNFGSLSNYSLSTMKLHFDLNLPYCKIYLLPKINIISRQIYVWLHINFQSHPNPKFTNSWSALDRLECTTQERLSKLIYIIQGKDYNLRGKCVKVQFLGNCKRTILHLEQWASLGQL